LIGKSTGTSHRFQKLEAGASYLTDLIAIGQAAALRRLASFSAQAALDQAVDGFGASPQRASRSRRGGAVGIPSPFGQLPADPVGASENTRWAIHGARLYTAVGAGEFQFGGFLRLD
jgi:hypothetical protein